MAVDWEASAKECFMPPTNFQSSLDLDMSRDTDLALQFGSSTQTDDAYVNLPSNFSGADSNAAAMFAQASGICLDLDTRIT